MQESVEVLCKHAKLCAAIEDGLISQSVVVSSSASYTLLVDAPWG